MSPADPAPTGLSRWRESSRKGFRDVVFREAFFDHLRGNFKLFGEKRGNPGPSKIPILAKINPFASNQINAPLRFSMQGGLRHQHESGECISLVLKPAMLLVRNGIQKLPPFIDGPKSPLFVQVTVEFAMPDFVRESKPIPTGATQIYEFVDVDFL